jgi:hypothetical protein
MTWVGLALDAVIDACLEVSSPYYRIKQIALPVSRRGV